MSGAFRFDVDWRSLDKMLKDLPKSMSKAVLRNALKKAAKPIRAAAEAGAPSDEGDLKNSMIVSTKLHGKRVRSKGALVFVGADHKKAPHAHLVEFGTAPRQHANGKSVGQMPANPFFRAAWDANKMNAFNILKKEIEVELMKAAKRLAARAESGKLSKTATRQLMR